MNHPPSLEGRLIHETSSILPTQWLLIVCCVRTCVRVRVYSSWNYEWITTRRGQQCSAEPDKEGVQ